MIPPRIRIVLIGPPGAGKSTIAQALEKHYEGSRWIQTSLALKADENAQEYIRRGELVPPELSHASLLTTLLSLRAQQQEEEQNPAARLGYILDGFPRMRENTLWLESSLSKEHLTPDIYVVLDCDASLCRERLAARHRDAADTTLSIVDKRLLEYGTRAHNLLQVDSITLSRVVTIHVHSSDTPEDMVEKVKKGIEKKFDVMKRKSAFDSYIRYDRPSYKVGIQSGRSQDQLIKYWSDKGLDNIVTIRRSRRTMDLETQILKIVNELNLVVSKLSSQDNACLQTRSMHCATKIQHCMDQLEMIESGVIFATPSLYTSPLTSPSNGASALTTLRYAKESIASGDTQSVVAGMQMITSFIKTQIPALIQRVVRSKDRDSGFVGNHRIQFVEVKPRDAARLLQEGVVDVLLAEDDCVNYLPTQDYTLQPVFNFDAEYPHVFITGESAPRLALVMRAQDAKEEHALCAEDLKIVSDYAHAARYFPNAKVMTIVSGKAEAFLVQLRDDYNAALVIVESGRTLEALNLVVVKHLRYIRPNLWVKTTSKTGIDFFRAMTDRLYTECAAPTPLPAQLPSPPPPGIIWSIPTPLFQDILPYIPEHHFTFEEFPLVIKGHSKEIRYIGRGLVLIRYLDTIYSFTHNRAGIVPTSGYLRLQATSCFLKALKAAGIPHAYLSIDFDKQLVLARLVVPHSSEYAKYGLPPFYPDDLTPEQFAALPRAPPIEVIAKQFHTGTSKHRYKGMHGTSVRQGHLAAGYKIECDSAYAGVVVRFDWRNPLTWPLDGSAEAVRICDEAMPVELANYYIDTVNAQRLALRTGYAMRRYLDLADIVWMDFCLFITEDGKMLFGELSQDCGRFRHFQLEHLDKDVWRGNGSNEEVLEKWRLLYEMLAPITPPIYPYFDYNKMAPARIIIGTTNTHKLREFTVILQQLPCHIETLSLDIPEPHNTFKANSMEKYKGYLQHLKTTNTPFTLLIVEDSGLCVDALGGAPGVHSARYTTSPGPHRSSSSPYSHWHPRDRQTIDFDNNVKVLSEMSSIPQDNRQAAFHITLTVGTSDSNVAQFSAESHGSIATEMRGTNGFGYDPIFIGNDTDGSTYAELDACRKSSRSHRTRAFINAFDYMIIHCLKST